MADEQPALYRQYLQSQAPDGTQTVREVVSPSLLDANAAAAAETAAGRTFTGFVAPDVMAGATRVPPPSPPPAAPPLPSAVSIPGAPSPVAGPASPWLSLLPPALATVGPLALSIAQPELGIPLWAASSLLAGTGMAGGEALKEQLAGQPLSAKDIATAGALGAGTDIGMTVATPYLAPVVKAATGRMAPVLESLGSLGGLLSPSAEAAADAHGVVTDLASRGADVLRGATKPAFEAARMAGAETPVATAGLQPYVAAANDTITAAGPTAAQAQEWGTVVAPMSQGQDGTFTALAGRQRQLENWIGDLRAKGVNTSALEELHAALGTQLDHAVTGTPAGALWSRYTAAQGEQLPTRWALNGLTEATPDTLGAALQQSPDAVGELAAAAESPAERDAVAQAWIASTREAAAQTANPAVAMQAAYDALGPATQTALFGDQRGAFAQLLGAAQQNVPGTLGSMLTSGLAGGVGHFFGVPGSVAGPLGRLGSDIAGPWLARQALASPLASGLAAGFAPVPGIVLPAAGRAGAQLYVERARGAGLPLLR
jgi:hypothetical protein